MRAFLLRPLPRRALLWASGLAAGLPAAHALLHPLLAAAGLGCP